MKEVIQCLIKWLDNVPSDDKAHQILRILAEGSLLQASTEENIKRFTNKDIFDAAKPETLDTPNKWVNWKNTVLPYWDIKKWHVIDLARNQGLDSYPDIEFYISDGGRGRPSSYWIVKKPLPEIVNGNESSNIEASSEHNIIHYDLADKGEVKPAWIAKWLLRNGEVRLSTRAIIIWLITIGGIAALISLANWIVLTAPRPVTTRELSMFLSMFIIPYGTWLFVIKPWFRLFDERIVVAPELLVSIEEKSAQIEIFRDGDLRLLRLVRYSAPCPICGATIHLGNGEPDFPRRLVGRCYDSPREHIFSFDRVTQKGTVLRGAELITPRDQDDVSHN